MRVVPALVILQEDFNKISALLAIAKPQIVDLLEEELDRAQVVNHDQLPKDIVTMNSIVTFIDLDSKKQDEVTLVFPHDADIEKNKISILAPIGAALIGLRTGQTIDWPVSSEKTRRISVTNVRQPNLI